MKTFRRRAYMKAIGLRLKRDKGIYIVKSKLAVDLYTPSEGTKEDRDNAVYLLTESLARWKKEKKKGLCVHE